MNHELDHGSRRLPRNTKLLYKKGKLVIAYSVVRFVILAGLYQVEFNPVLSIQSENVLAYIVERVFEQFDLTDRQAGKQTDRETDEHIVTETLGQHLGKYRSTSALVLKAGTSSRDSEVVLTLVFSRHLQSARTVFLGGLVPFVNI